MAIVNPTPVVMSFIQTAKTDSTFNMQNLDVMQAIIDTYKNKIAKSEKNDELLYIKDLDIKCTITDKTLSVLITKGSCVYGDTVYQFNNDIMYTFPVPSNETTYSVISYLDSAKNSFAVIDVIEKSNTKQIDKMAKNVYLLAEIKYDPATKEIEIDDIGIAKYGDKRNAVSKKINNLVSDTSDLKKDFVNALKGNGFQKLPGGLIIQWGSINWINRSSRRGSRMWHTITFPTAFPNKCLGLVATNSFPDNGSESTEHTLAVSIISNSQGKIREERVYGSNGGKEHGHTFWLALGF